LTHLAEQFRCTLPKGVSEDVDGYVYCSLTSTFDAASLEAPCPVLLKALEAIGATRLYATYDGGNDEGFAHADRLQVGEVVRTAKEVARLLAKSPYAPELRRAMPAYNADYYATQTDEGLIGIALDDLAMQLTCALLQGGWGTGEYMIYGAFWADLNTGKLLDDANAKGGS